MSQATLLLIIMLAAASALFPELRQPPPPPEGGFAKLPPLLTTADGKPVATASAWKRRRAEIRNAWTEILGPFPRRVSLRTEELSREELPDHTRILLRYRDDAREESDAYLLLPKGGGDGKHPGMVVLHQTADENLREPVGITGREGMHVALRLVRRGYVCVCPRNFLWNDRTVSYQEGTDRTLRGGWKTGMAKMTWDAIRATDLLLTRPEVDPKRIGSIGHSLGGKEVIYHAAFDERIRAAASCEGGVGISFSNWDADWYLGKQVHAPGFQHDHHELLALVAPRAFLLVGGGSADGAQSWPYVEAARPVWRLFGAEDRLGLLLHPAGHDFPPPGPQRELLERWLDTQLASTASSTTTSSSRASLPRATMARTASPGESGVRLR